jgi:hypothetical protein
MKPSIQKTCQTAGVIVFAALAMYTVTARADFASRILAPKSMTQLSPGSTQALNPQPIPPVLGQRQALNPQPIPPGRGMLTPIRNPGDPPRPERPGSKQALNPQPIPPVLGQRQALNPQPIPPGRPVLGGQNALNPQPIPPVLGQRQALNPQPIPPGRGMLTPIRNPGDPPWVLRYSGVRSRSF